MISLTKRETNRDIDVQIDVDKETGRDGEKERDMYTDYLYRQISSERWIQMIRYCTLPPYLLLLPYDIDENKDEGICTGTDTDIDIDRYK